MHVEHTRHHGMDAVVITTRSASWTYQLNAGGFSSLIDRDDQEWIGFAPGPSGGAAGAAHVYRGIPNLVHPDDIGHPGHDACASQVEEEPDAVVISTTSDDQNWAWKWRITEDHATLAVTGTPNDRSYWFLYEGIPGGRYDPSRSFWGSDTEGRCEDTPDIFAGAGPGGAVIMDRRWAYFGHRDLDRVLLCTHPTSCGEPSFFAYMHAFDAQGMCVFGFGRAHTHEPVPCLTAAHRFSVSLVESAVHEDVARIAESIQ